MLRGFILYRPPPLGRHGVGEALRTRSVLEAYQLTNRFLAECTDNQAPKAATLAVSEPHVAAGESAEPPGRLAEAAARQLGPGALAPLSNEERVWEWQAAPGPDFAARVAAFVAFAVAGEKLPRIHVNAAVRRHDAPKTPQVQLTLRHDLRLTAAGSGEVLPFQDEALYLPGWGQSRLDLLLGPNRVFTVLHFPFESAGPELARCVADIEATGLRLAPARFRLCRLNARGDGYVERKL